MKILITSILIFFITNSYSQSDSFTTDDLKKVIKLTSFEGVKRMKDYSPQQINDFFAAIESNSGLLNQININSWSNCDYYKVDNFNKYNLNYKKVTRETFNFYCKELNALMLLDDIIPQNK